jgi:kumamolisin
MQRANGRVAIKGSNRHKLPGATPVGATNENERLKVSLYVRQNPASRLERAKVTEELSQQMPKRRRYPDAKEFEALFGASAQELRRVRDWAEKQGFKVLDTNAASRRVLIEGAVRQVNEAFGTTLTEFDHPTLGRFRGREGALHIDAEVFGVIEGVFGLDNRRVGHSRRRRLDVSPVALSSLSAKRTGKIAANPFPGTFFPPEVANLYGYPTSTGSGQNVAVFAFNGAVDGDPHGGYDPGALNTYFTQVLGGAMPVLNNVVVQGPGNFPGPDSQASDQNGDSTGEVMLDLCVVGSVAPGANIFVYFTEFTTQGWVDALHQAITDANNIAVISISYGNPEDDPQGAWTAMGVKVVDQSLQAAVAKGITICVSAGDDGSGDGVPSGAHVDFPASSPWVLAVGGTTLKASGGTITSEVVWNETRIGEGAGGGGVSVVFSKPTYQDATAIPVSADPPHRVGRGLPDVSAVADPETGVVIMHIDGKSLEAIGGTSASAPLWASLIARLNQGLGTRCGFLNPVLYAKAGSSLRDITEGNIGSYSATTGWDACTGFGAPGGASLFQALSAGTSNIKLKKTAKPK